MSDALQLPPRPKLEEYKRLAKDLQRACNSGRSAEIRDWAAQCTERIARQRSVKITPRIRREIDREAERIQQRWNEFEKTNKLSGRYTLANAQSFLARAHGFASWPKFTRHLQALARPGSPVSQFEAAVDAIVAGDLRKLKTLLAANPQLVRERSTREHRSTLLHYVSANGVEDFRQRTPKNIVEIARLLLSAGADVNAESDAYAGRSTTLGLTATSFHPENAGVQPQLMELLIDHGAIIDGPDSGSGVAGCLHNGRAQAAEFLANRGARLDLEGAAGVGRLDAVKSFFREDRRLKPPATRKQLASGFGAACGFGRTRVVDFLLQRGMKANAKLSKGEETGLHLAALGGHADTLKLLLNRGAQIDAKDATYHGTPLDWALYGWSTRPKNAKLGHYYKSVAVLARAGAKLDARQWYDPNSSEPGMLDKIRSDPRMRAALHAQSQRGLPRPAARS